MSDEIRVAFVGNIVNNFFREASILQNSKGVSCDLFLYHDCNTPNTELPESDIPGFKYPQWIKHLPEYSRASILSCFLPKSIARRCFKSFYKLINDLNSYDLCIFSGPELVILPFVSTKTVFRATGSDLTVFPVMSFRESNLLRYQSKSLIERFKTPLNFLLYYIKRNSYRKGVFNADFIDANESPYIWALKRLGNIKAKKLNFFKLAIDTKIFFHYQNNKPFLKKWNLTKKNFIVFMPSRIMISDSYLHKVTGQWKASDEAIIGFRKFLDKLNNDEKKMVILVIPDRTRSDELEKAKKLIQDLKLTENVRFTKGEAEEGLTRSELIELYNCSDVVMDDFGAGWFGSVVVESAACGCPILTYVREESMRKKYSWHPFQVARKSHEISQVMEKLYRDYSYRLLVSEKSINWINEYHSPSAIKDTYIKNFRAMVVNKGIQNQ